MKRTINLIVLHCSDSDNPNHDSVHVIDQWHRERGWSGIGYHYFIKKNGEIQKGRNLETKGAHAYGFNKNSIGICLSGKDKFTIDQYKACAGLVGKLLDKFDLSIIDMVGHNELNEDKTCPNFPISQVTQRIIGPLRNSTNIS